MRFPRSNRTPLLVACLAVGLPLPTLAADEPVADSQWGLGLGVAVSQRPYRDAENKTRALPLLMYENRWVRIGGTGIDLKLPSAGPVSFALRARYAFDGYEQSDAPILNGMAERKDSLWLGGAAKWRNDIADLSAEWVGDASGNSKGQQFKLQLDRSFKAGAFQFTPRLAATWLDRKYVDYYYGVTAPEAAGNRPFYEGAATVNAEVGLRTVYGLAPRHALSLDVGTTRLGTGIKDSPLVERRNVSRLFFGYVHRF